MALPIVESIPDAVDSPYPGGTITLDVDASDTQRGIFRVTQTIPVAPGSARLTLLHPQWLPGNHGPKGSTSEVVDLRFTAGGKVLEWRRDPLEVNAFHVTLPARTSEVVAKFIRTTPLQASEGRIVMTQEMLNLQWEQVSLYPAGHFVRQIRFKPSVTFPQGWTAATVLDGPSGNTGKVSWAEVDYETLVDSPIFAGLHARKWDLGNRISLSAVADKPELLALPPERLPALKALGDEALIAFGSRHFDRYEFLVALSDRMGAIGLEHHRSSENQMEPDNFIAWERMDWDRNVLAHELSHSWVGKFRRPAKMWTPDYRTPMQDNLLWVYEGQNQFWGLVLAARSGLQSKETVLGMLASQAGYYAAQPGRSWRSLEDTTHESIISARRPQPWRTLARDEDYYNEGALIWLEVDQVIRAGTAGRKGLDDFAKQFFGIRDGDWGVVPYEFEDVVAGLNAVYPHDWATFLKTRTEAPGQPAPLKGIEMAGYRLVWREEPNSFEKAVLDETKRLSLGYSLGITLSADGVISNPRWDSPAANAGLVTGTKVVAVGGIAYDPDVMRKAITAAKGGNKPIELLVKRGDRFLTVPVTWNGGLRYPWLERVPGGRGASTSSGGTGLDLLLSPRRNVSRK